MGSEGIHQINLISKTESPKTLVFSDVTTPAPRKGYTSKALNKQTTSLLIAERPI